MMLRNPSGGTTRTLNKRLETVASYERLLEALHAHKDGLGLDLGLCAETTPFPLVLNLPALFIIRVAFNTGG